MQIKKQQSKMFIKSHIFTSIFLRLTRTNISLFTTRVLLSVIIKITTIPDDSKLSNLMPQLTLGGKSGSVLVDKNSANRYRSTPYFLFLKSEFLSQIKIFLTMNDEKSFCQNVDKTFRFVFNISRENWLVSSNKKNSFILYFLRNAI